MDTRLYAFIDPGLPGKRGPGYGGTYEASSLTDAYFQWCEGMEVPPRLAGIGAEPSLAVYIVSSDEYGVLEDWFESSSDEAMPMPSGAPLDLSTEPSLRREEFPEISKWREDWD